MKTTANKITREARIVVALLIASVVVLAWWITEAGKLGDIYGQLVLVGALVFISATGSYIVTSELRDIQSRKTRKTLNKYHTQQVTELSDAIYKLERDNARLAHSSFDAIEKLSGEYDALKLSLETLTEQNRDTVARFAHARELLAETGLDLVDHEQADAYSDKLHTLNHALWAFGYAMVEDSDLLNGAWDTLRGIDETELTDTAKAQAFADYVVFIYSDEPEFTITTPAKLEYTSSASTAFMVGTLDKAYLVGNETRYPLA